MSIQEIHVFMGGYPTLEAIEHVHDVTDLERATEACRFFFPRVSMEDIEDNIECWQKLHQTIEEEPVVEEFRSMYRVLAALGIEKGKPFAPDPRMKSILERAAKEGRRPMPAHGR